MEKKAILDEMFNQAKIYIDAKVNMIIQTLHEDECIPDNCSRCGQELIEIYSRPEELMQGWNDYDLIVFKCHKCQLLYAFYFEPESFDPLTEATEEEHAGEQAIQPKQWKNVGKHQWGEGKRPKFPKECAEAYTKEILDPNNLNEKLNHLNNTKLQALQRAGISLETLNLARNKVLRYVQGKKITMKKLITLLASAIYVTANGVTTNGGLWKHQGEGISERKLEEIFSITRKTLRKWVKVLKNHAY
ncbi:cyclin domain-containing protein [Candidatus Bathyarchaeota archaeon]|nr:cyclin domain-containing protein [Candidatus Bathyarchaeota archaeon]